jgi:hypothetical protein
MSPNDIGDNMTDIGNQPTGTRQASRTDYADDRTVDWSETRRGYKTTELLLTLVAAVASIVAAYASRSGQGAFPVRWGWLLAIVVVSAYVLSRGIAKAGVTDRAEHRLNDRR